MESHRKTLFWTFLVISLFIMLPSCSQGGSGNKEQTTVLTDQDGGIYNLSQDITLTIPARAVDQETTITFQKINPKVFKSFYRSQDTDENRMISAFNLGPDNLSFQTPIKISIQNIDYRQGYLPILYQIDLDEESMHLADTTLEYDPDTSTLSLFLEHFSSYAAYLEKGYISPECILTPCRCGEINIEQNESDVMCSENDCQVLTSEISVTYVECGGQVEDVTIKEISPSCQPGLILEPAQSKLPPEGNTEVTGTVLIGCAAFPDQNVEFTSNQLGEVTPSTGLSDSGGEAKTVFTAGEEIGIAVVTATANGSYYSYEVITQEETSFKDQKTYEISETVDIEIRPLKGVLEGTFSGCNEIVCLEGYQMKLEFTINDLDWELGYWSGESIFSQSGDLVSNVADGSVANLYMASGIEETIQGIAYQDSGELELNYLTQLLIEHFKWDMESHGYSTEMFIEDLFGIGIGDGMDSDGLPEPLRFKIDDLETPQQGSVIIELMFLNQGIPGTYILSFE